MVSSRTFRNRLAQVGCREMTSVAVIEAHVMWIHFVNVQVAVCVLVTIRLVVLGISQPPIAAVRCAPRPLLRLTTFHDIPRATATAVRGTSHVHNQVRLPRVIANDLLSAYYIAHHRKVVLIVRRPELETCRARMLFAALLDSQAVLDLDQLTRRIALHVQAGGLAIFWGFREHSCPWARAWVGHLHAGRDTPSHCLHITLFRGAHTTTTIYPHYP